MNETENEVTEAGTEASVTAANRVAIIGTGHVGSTTAYALLMSGSVREIVLVGKDAREAEGEVMDLQHAVPLHDHPVRIFAGDYREAAQSSVVVIAAGVKGEPGESRLDLLNRNAVVVRECINSLITENFNGIVLMIANPVDALAQIAQQESGLPVERVIGSGTTLDTARLRSMLGEMLAVSPQSVHAYIIGEHGDSEIAAWSSARIAGLPLENYSQTEETHELPDFNELLQRVRRAGPDIAERKGYTSFAIASAAVRICEAILRDGHTVLPVSTMMTGQYGIEGVYLSLPCVIGRRGIERVIEIPLSERERRGLRASADVLKEAIANLQKADSASP